MTMDELIRFRFDKQTQFNNIEIYNRSVNRLKSRNEFYNSSYTEYSTKIGELYRKVNHYRELCIYYQAMILIHKYGFDKAEELMRTKINDKVAGSHSQSYNRYLFDYRLHRLVTKSKLPSRSDCIEGLNEARLNLKTLKVLINSCGNVQSKEVKSSNDLIINNNRLPYIYKCDKDGKLTYYI